MGVAQEAKSVFAHSPAAESGGRHCFLGAVVQGPLELLLQVFRPGYCISVLSDGRFYGVWASHVDGRETLENCSDRAAAERVVSETEKQMQKGS